MLSGFLITYLILKEIETRGCLDARAFYIRRCLRIWPLYYAVVAVGFLVYSPEQFAGPTTGPLPSPIYYLTFQANRAALAYNVIPLYLAITWSIAIEEQFYLVWPQFFSRLSRSRFMLIFWSIMVASVSFRVAHRNEPMVLAVHTLSVMSDFAVGGLVAYGAVKSGAPQRWVGSLGRRQIVLFYLVVITLLLLRDTVYAPTSSYVLQRLQSLATIFRRLILSVCFAFIIAEQNWAVNSPMKLSRLRLLSSLGKYTYGLYLLHPLALCAAARWVGVPAQGSVSFQSDVARGILGLVLTLVLGVTSYHLFEMPFLRFKQRFTFVVSIGNVKVE